MDIFFYNFSILFFTNSLSISQLFVDRMTTRRPNLLLGLTGINTADKWANSSNKLVIGVAYVQLLHWKRKKNSGRYVTDSERVFSNRSA
jgi:hypothetical protein